MWPDLIQKSKDGGIDVIETYVFWNLHEPVRRQVLFFFIVFPLSYCYSSVFYIAVLWVLKINDGLHILAWQYNFEGRGDLVGFVKAVAAAGLYVHLRIGPYACAEWNYG